MRRRRLLAAVGTAAAAPLSGCGYAHAGGELRRREEAVAGGVGELTLATGDDRIVGVSNGRHYVFTDDDTEWVDGAELTVADREGRTLWSHVHRAESHAVAVDEVVYLLDSSGRLVAVGSTGETTPDSDGAEELWRTSLPDARAPLAADGRGVYINIGGIAAVRDGAVAWRRRSLAPVEELWTFDGGLLVRTDEALVALDGDGEQRWRRPLDPDTPVAVEAGHAVLPGDGVIGIAPDGTVDWRLDAPGAVRSIAGTDGRVAVVGAGGTRAVDAADGTRLWSAAATERPPATVVGTEGLYGIYDGGCLAVAVDGTGRQWDRRLESHRADCDAVAGWLDGEMVAFLLERGEIVWLQRAEQDRGLL